MFEEEFIANKLRKFSLIDICLVSIVYFLVGLLIATNYYPLQNISWIFYLVLICITGIPIILHLFTVEGPLLDRIHHYVKTNNQAYQTLLFLTMFFLGCIVATFITSLCLIPSYIYIILIIIFAIKPMRSNLFW